MTVKEAIDLVDKLKPNQFDMAVKSGWLRDVDAAIHTDIIMTHELGEGETDSFDGDGYAEEEHELLAKSPHDDLYIYYLATQIDLYNAELGKYANDMTLYNAAYDNYSAWYTRTHMPKQKTRQFRF